MANELSSVSLEAIVDEEIRPLMKAWLDKNLATVVEASVRETIARLSAPEGG